MQAILMMEGESILFDLDQVQEFSSVVSPTLNYQSIFDISERISPSSGLGRWLQTEHSDGKVIFYQDCTDGRLKIIYPGPVSEVKTEIVFTKRDGTEKSLILPEGAWSTQEAIICLLFSSRSWFDGNNFVGLPEVLTREAIVNEFTD